MGNLTKEQIDLANQRAEWFKTRGQGMMSSMMYSEAEAQFIEMAQGGDGTITMQGNIREQYYSGMPDEFFQLVCDLVGWDYTKRY